MNKTRSEIGKLKFHAAAKRFLGVHCCETKVTTLLKQEQGSGAYWSSRNATGF